jgi:hypothetical protein
MQRQAAPLSLLGNAQTRIIIINGYVSQTYFVFALLPAFLFSRSGKKPTKIQAVRFYYLPS